MIGLTDAQFDRLEHQLLASGLHTKGLYDDLLDHYYCLTEQYMTTGLPFDDAANRALSELAPTGFKSIEEELITLLTFNFQINMTRILFAFGFVATFVLMISMLFKILHWPGANMLMTSGLVSLLVVAIPVLILNLSGKASPEKRRSTFGIFATIFLCTGFLFKIMHWPGANINILLGFAVLSLAFLPMFFWQLYKKSVGKMAV